MRRLGGEGAEEKVEVEVVRPSRPKAPGVKGEHRGAETPLASANPFLTGMAQRTIRFRIRPDGRVEERVEGAMGQSCQQLTERIEARLGTLQQRRQTSEAFVAEESALTLEQPLTAHQPVG